MQFKIEGASMPDRSRRSFRRRNRLQSYQLHGLDERNRRYADAYRRRVLRGAQAARSAVVHSLLPISPRGRVAHCLCPAISRGAFSPSTLAAGSPGLPQGDISRRPKIGRARNCVPEKTGHGFFGGEGYLLQKVTGPGTVWLDLSGEVVTQELAPGEKLLVHAGHVGIQSPVGQLRHPDGPAASSNILFGGEGLYLATLTGPGKVWLQSMPIINLAEASPRAQTMMTQTDGQRRHPAGLGGRSISR